MDLSPNLKAKVTVITYVGFNENSADRNTTSTSRDVCDAETLTETSDPLLDERHVTTHDNVELQTWSVFNQGSGPSKSVTTAALSSLTSPPATPDLLSSDLRRKIRRTGFSSILSLPSVNDNAQGNVIGTMARTKQTSEKQLLFPDASGGQQKIMHGPNVLVPSTTTSASVTSTNAPNPLLKKDPDQPDLRRTTVESMYPWRRSVCCSDTV